MGVEAAVAGQMGKASPAAGTRMRAAGSPPARGLESWDLEPKVRDARAAPHCVHQCHVHILLILQISMCYGPVCHACLLQILCDLPSSGASAGRWLPCSMTWCREGFPR